ncbi:hypothetical protein [Saccharothrix australiensis]|uniref:Putative lipoprotein with Yx(FWY)xxD motif n=1 Tax=Saccharothrix australiensis TaxID=2072 RepID=A0A495W8V3_9PSEU|nr:hypothetical protein [Saccharothrix australiensis]RKT56218.1 putative lipoprotein with Yx(FWY)xxD motif [Saccharothrix australiensis]
MRGRRHHRYPLLVAALSLIGACGATGGDAAGGQDGADGEPGTTTFRQGPGSGAEPHQMLSATESELVGWFVADAGGFALYRSDQDTATPPKSTCDGECAKTWLPVLVGAHTMTSGVDPTLVGSVARADGGRQVTLAGWPLYRFTGDRQPGEPAGQGKGGTWFAVTPEGRKAQAEAGAATGSGS